ncbi:pyroglutamyl-peptidase I [Pseudolabrys sp. FHR47]|uniref:pyroglutamyl-peptidase I n=1 Tax=Pseudolabrys sp. FHR47 TaxID=2562284 RepID=UPI0010BE468F|nr:pyroglutamyl-peptidase I [Pseudolabrys sp. FHR47]
MPTILITGFGPFPGAPYNPTVKLVRALARLRRPVLADARIVTHIFTTSYAAVDRDLPALIAQHRPDALLMFGLHGRAKAIRIETRARNALALLPDASGKVLRRGVIAAGAPSAKCMPMPAQRLLAAARAAQVPAVLSRDAGRYLCNYLCWRAVDSGVRLAVFVHVPKVARLARPLGSRTASFSVRPRESGGPDRKALGSRFRGNERRTGLRSGRTTSRKKFTAADLARAGEKVLVALNAAVNRT